MHGTAVTWHVMDLEHRSLVGIGGFWDGKPSLVRFLRGANWGYLMFLCIYMPSGFIE